MDNTFFNDRTPHLEVDVSAVDEQPEEVAKPIEVEDPMVLYMPRKDFDGRINQREFKFKKGQQVKVTRDVANMLLEDEDRGYVKEQ